jgi:hypothetical protein
MYGCDLACLGLKRRAKLSDTECMKEDMHEHMFGVEKGFGQVRFGLLGMQGWSWSWVPFTGRVGQVKGDQGCTGFVALGLSCMGQETVHGQGEQALQCVSQANKRRPTKSFGCVRRRESCRAGKFLSVVLRFRILCRILLYGCLCDASCVIQLRVTKINFQISVCW